MRGFFLLPRTSVCALFALLALVQGPLFSWPSNPGRPAELGVGPNANPPPPAHADLGDRHPMYRRHDGDLAATMADTRRAYLAWRERQTDALAKTEPGAWRLLPDVTTGAAELSTTGATADDARFAPFALADDVIGTWKKLAPKNPDTALLVRRIDATADCTLTLGFGGGTHLAVYLNGKELISADSARIERLGTTFDEQDDPVLDRLMVDLPLRAGANHLVVAVKMGHSSRRVFACTRTVNAVQRLWDWLTYDFPPHAHRLLAEMPADWFGHDTLAPTKPRRDEWQTAARLYRTDTPELQEGRPYTQNDDPLPEKDRKAGLLNDGWFDARDRAFETALLAGLKTPAPATNASDEAWLAACEDASQRAELARQFASLRAAVVSLGESHASYPAKALLADIASLEKRVATAPAPLVASKVAAFGLEALKRRALVTSNPLLAGKELLFVARHTYASHHIYDDHNHGPRSFEGNILRHSIDTGETRSVLPALNGGVFDRYDLSYDAQRLVFAYRRPHEGGFRIYEASLDGSGVRRLTQPPADEDERVRQHSEYTPEELAANATLPGHWTDDVQPCYLPDDGVVFVSTRPEYSILCGSHETTVTVLYRVERDGTGLHQLSRSALSELFPSVGHDGRILYTRYEYVMKGNVVVHGVWAMRPDGSGSEEVYGDNIQVPPAFAHARPVPGRDDLLVAIGAGHEPGAHGSVLFIDTTKDRRYTDAMQFLTPEVSNYGMSPKQFRNGRWVFRDMYGPVFSDPFPLDDRFVLVSHNPTSRITDPRAYGIWLIDTFGNRVLVHQEKDISCFEPMVLEARKRPHVLPKLPFIAQEEPEKPASYASDRGEGTLILAEAERGLPGVKPGTVKYLRVLEQVPRPWSGTNPLGKEYYPGSATAITHGTHIWVGVDVGIVPVEADGSAHFKVPADKNIFFQALDENYRAVQVMRTFINVRPGEVRSCIGCHDDRRTPSSSLPMPLALKRKADSPRPQPGVAAVPRPFHFPTDIQPIMNRSCVSCHDGSKGKDDWNFRADSDEYLFSKGYVQLVGRGMVSIVEEHKAAMWLNAPNGPLVSFAGMEHAPATPPYTYGANASKLSKVLDDERHRGLLTKEERLAFDTWMDLNAQYYGSYWGHRHPDYKDLPGYRLAPDLTAARGEPPFLVHPMPGAK